MRARSSTGKESPGKVPGGEGHGKERPGKEPSDRAKRVRRSRTARARAAAGGVEPDELNEFTPEQGHLLVRQDAGARQRDARAAARPGLAPDAFTWSEVPPDPDPDAVLLLQDGPAAFGWKALAMGVTLVAAGLAMAAVGVTLLQVPPAPRRVSGPPAPDRGAARAGWIESRTMPLAMAAAVAPSMTPPPSLAAQLALTTVARVEPPARLEPPTRLEAPRAAAATNARATTRAPERPPVARQTSEAPRLGTRVARDMPVAAARPAAPAVAAVPTAPVTVAEVPKPSPAPVASSSAPPSTAPPASAPGPAAIAAAPPAAVPSASATFAPAVVPAPDPSPAPPPASARASTPADVPAATQDVVTAVLRTSPREAERNAIESLLTRYRHAYNRLDADAASAVWPTVDERSLSRAFEQIEAQNVSFDDCRIEMGGVIAVAACTGTARYVPKVGSRTPRAESRRWRFNLRKASAGWVIDRVEAR